MNALIGAANDSEPWVRITAVRALGYVTGDPRATSAIAAHLTDSSRVVRVSAAESLMMHGITTLDGVPGRVLAAVQDEWAESLRTFNDDANDQTTLGSLESVRGRSDAAAAAFGSAIKLDPTAPRPRVLLGVLYARAGRFDDALQQFKSAKAAAPDYPNIDRLIEEAQKRR